jgi:hypothetical protein
MRTGDLLFILVILIAGSIGGIALMASQQNPTTTEDTFGSATSEQTNKTSEMVSEVGVAEANYSGYFVLFAALAIVISIIIGAMILLRKGGLGRGKYRTG